MAMDSGCFKFTDKPVTYMEAVNRCNREVLRSKLLTNSDDYNVVRYLLGINHHRDDTIWGKTSGSQPTYRTLSIINH